MNQPVNGHQQVHMQQQGNGLAVTGLVLGIIGLVFFWTIWLGVILGILGIVFGGIGASKPVKRGMAIAGIVLGVLALLLSIFWPVIGAALIWASL